MPSRYLVVPSMSNNTLTVFDLETHAVAKHLGLPKRGPSAVFASPDGEKLYCLASGGCDVVVIDVKTWAVDHVVPVEGSIVDRGKVPGVGRTFWVSVILQGHVHAVDTVSGTVTHSFPKAGPGFTVSDDGTLLYTLELHKRKDQGVFHVRDVASGQVLGSTQVPLMKGVPLGLWRSGTKVYWTELGKNGAVHVLDASDLAAPAYVTRIPVGTAPLACSVSPRGEVWVPNSADGTVSIISTETDQVLRTIDVGTYVAEITHLDDRVYLNQSKKAGRRSFWNSMWVTVPAPYLGVYITPKTGRPKTRRIIDHPAEVVAYDATTYERLDLPAMTLPSIGFTSAALVLTP